MNQSIHIFRKDVRHLWPELVIYAAFLITFAWATPQGWDGGLRFNSLLQILLVLLRAIFFILWLVIIARLIQDESLVGDQQFWITRPYTKLSLAAAKLLFLIVGVALPFALMQVYLLWHAGLHSFTVFPALLLNLCFLTLLCWLPFAAVASVTSTLPRMAMSLLGTVIVSIIVLVIVGRSIGLRMNPPYFLPVIATVSTLLLAGSLLYQYWTRSTNYVRIVLLAMPALLFILFAVYPTASLIPFRYSAPQAGASHLVFDPDPLRQERQDGEEVNFGGQVLVNLPIHIDGLDPKARLGDSGISVTADVPGFHYQSPWLPGGLSGSSTTLILPRDVAHKLEAAPAHLHMVLVGDQLLPGSPQPATAASRFEVPGHGACVLPEDGIGGTFCHYAYRNPPPTEVKGTATLPPCAPGAPTQPGTAEIPAFPQTPSLDPVEQVDLAMRPAPGAICSGAALTFTEYRPAGHIRAELDVPALSLGAYVRRNHPMVQHMPSTAPEPPPAAARTPRGQAGGAGSVR